MGLRKLVALLRFSSFHCWQQLLKESYCREIATDSFADTRHICSTRRFTPEVEPCKKEWSRVLSAQGSPLFISDTSQQNYVRITLVQLLAFTWLWIQWQYLLGLVESFDSHLQHRDIYFNRLYQLVAGKKIEIIWYRLGDTSGDPCRSVLGCEP